MSNVTVRTKPWKYHFVQVDTLTDRNAVVAAVTFRPEADPVSGNYDSYTVTDSAKREPGDVNDRTIGEQLAIGRALVKLGRDLQKAANTRVKS